MNFGASGQSGGLPGIASTSDSAAISTKSAIGPGKIIITDDPAQIALSGKGVDQSISGISRDVGVGRDSSGKIANTFNPNEVHATLAITGAFSATAAKAVGDYAGDKLKEANGLRIKEHNETDPAKKAELGKSAAALEENWREGGSAKVALHTVVGGLVGGADGALGAGTTAVMTPAIVARIAQLDIPDGVKGALILGAAAAVGSVSGGEAGAVAAVNEVENNYLKHKQLISLREKLQLCEKRSCADTERQSIIDSYLKASAANDASLAACVTKECIDGHSQEIDAAGKIQYAVLSEIDGTAGNELRMRQVKSSAINHQYKKVEAVNKANKELRQWAVTNCKGIALNECASRLKQEKKFVAGLAVDFMPLLGDAKGLAEAESPTDYALAVLGIVAGPLGDVFKALKKVENAAPAANFIPSASLPNSAAGDGSLDSASRIRAIVLENIEASTAGNTSTNFSDFVKREALTREALATNQSPWPLGYSPTLRPMTVEEQFNMVLDGNQAQGLAGPGGFAVFADVRASSSRVLHWQLLKNLSQTFRSCNATRLFARSTLLLDL